MSRSPTRRRSRTHRLDAVQKPRGTFHPRVQKVGPEHFGIVAVDCAKARSKWLLADFYGHILVPPTLVTHNRHALKSKKGVRLGFPAVVSGCFGQSTHRE